MVYTIVIYKAGKARIHKFPSLEAAKIIASAIFEKTGVIAGIEVQS